MTSESVVSGRGGSIGHEDASHHCRGRNMPPTGTSSTFDPLHVPDGLSNGKQGRQCEGLNPMEIDPAVLTAAGHPSMRTRAVVAAYKRAMDGDCFSDAVEAV